MLISVIQSFFQYVATQVAIINPSQLMGPITEARDWPQTPPQAGTLYLLVLANKPIGGTQNQNLYEFIRIYYSLFTWFPNPLNLSSSAELGKSPIWL